MAEDTAVIHLITVAILTIHMGAVIHINSPITAATIEITNATYQELRAIQLKSKEERIFSDSSLLFCVLVFFFLFFFVVSFNIFEHFCEVIPNG